MQDLTALNSTLPSTTTYALHSGMPMCARSEPFNIWAVTCCAVCELIWEIPLFFQVPVSTGGILMGHPFNAHSWNAEVVSPFYSILRNAIQ